MGGARFYKPELDGLRFVAFFLVFLHHALPVVPARWEALGAGGATAAALGTLVSSFAYGVDLFFVLSSFLITELLLREQSAFGRLDVRAFWVRRVLRIWPLFFFFLALSVPLDRLVLGLGGLSWRSLGAFVALVGNWAIAAWGEPPSVASPLWSVSVEEQFYLAWPLVVARVPAARLGRVAWLLVAVAVVARPLTVLAGHPHPAVWVSTFTRLDSIAAGVLLALWLRQRPQAESRWAPWLLLLGPGLWLAAEWVAPPSEQRLWGVPWSYCVVASGAVCMVAGALALPGRLRAALTVRPLVYLGRISYGLYVFHSLGLSLSAQYVRPLLPAGAGLGHGVVGLGLTVAMAALSFRFLEQPFLRLKRRYTLVPSRE